MEAKTELSACFVQALMHSHEELHVTSRFKKHVAAPGGPEKVKLLRAGREQDPAGRLKSQDFPVRSRKKIQVMS